MKKIIFLFLFVAILVSNCSVKKRSYRKGYHVDWAFKSKNIKPDKTQKLKNNTKNTSNKNEEVVGFKNDPEQQFVLADNKFDKNLSFKSKKYLLLKDTCGDIINLRNGNAVSAKVIEISETLIKYKRCDNLDGPLMVINKNDAHSIKYVNGATENFIKTVEKDDSRSVSSSNKPQNFSGEKKVHPLAYVVLACTIGIIIPFLFGLTLLAALIIAPIAKAKINAEPNKYTGLLLVKICQTILYVILAITALFIILLLLSL